MALTAQAERLTETHRLAQTRLGATTVTRLLDTFDLLDPTNVARTFARWLRVALPVIEGQYRMSSRLAMNYLSTFRALELGTLEGFTPLLADALDTTAATTSLTVTGPVSLKAAAARGVPLEQAVTNAKSAASRAAMRHALAGGRSTIQRTVAADRRAQGYRRVVSGSACKFCELLAGRGAVYNARTVDFQAHDGCSCSSEPVYRR